MAALGVHLRQLGNITSSVKGGAPEQLVYDQNNRLVSYNGSEITYDADGNITDTFTYDTYGKLTERIGTSEIIFLYNGRNGVVTDQNGLLYMRARYYSPDLKRFVNMDIIAGEITDPATLNRYAYANGNPVSNIDPFGLSAERGNNSNVISGLQGLYNLAYNYYNYVYNKNDRMNFSNDAVMKYIIYQRYYKSSTAKGIAWETIAGPIDSGFMKYMENHNEYSFLQGDVVFTDPYSGNRIDFSHMIATLNANTFDRPGMGLIDKDLNAFAGWAGDLVTLAGDAQANKNASSSL